MEWATFEKEGSLHEIEELGTLCQLCQIFALPEKIMY